MAGQKQPNQPVGFGNGRRTLRQFGGHFITAIVILLLLASLYTMLVEEREPAKELAISQVAQDVAAGQIKKITVHGNDLELEFQNGEKGTARKEEGVSLSETLKNYGVPAEALTALTLEVKNETGVGFWLLNILPFLLPVLMVLLFLWLISKQVRGASMQAFSFGQSKAKIIDPTDMSQRITFKDVAGVREAKEELLEIVDFLKNPGKFLEIGARIPKGVLLMGAPGTGKTLLARAVAGEAHVPFLYLSGSDFVEMFVGVGASVTGDTPVLVRKNGVVELKPISEVVDAYYAEGETNQVKRVDDLETLGFASKETGFRGASGEKQFFGGSRWSKARGVLRHKVRRIYRIRYRGGEMRTTGDHSVFVRERNMIRAKRADELRPGESLVGLPFRVRGAFVPGIGTKHDTRAHIFEEHEPLVLDVYGSEAEAFTRAYQYAKETVGTVSSYTVANELGVSQTTVVNWRNGAHLPKLLASPTARRTPDRVVATEELMRLLGYYAAEGDATDYGVRLTFGLHERDLHQDAASLFAFVFNQAVRYEPHSETNSMRLIISSRPLADFFKRHCGTGSKEKRLPSFLWTLPKRYFLAYLEGYARGDGYTDKSGKLSIVSVSYRHIRELAWLAAMHGIATGVRETIYPAGRTICPGGPPLPETRARNLIIGKTSHPFFPYAGTTGQMKRPIIESVTAEPYDGYVYDFCGCDNEAFFGGEKPVLLHNSRVRDLFRLAKKLAPSIIFIDEIDAIGRHRGYGLGGGNDEREQTLNQILVELDGFEPNEKLVVMAATNRPDVLDPALLRPGRFDRRVVLDVPDLKDREEILQIYARKKPIGPDVNLRVIAERTPGFCGADLANLMNEGAILAARENRKEVTQYDLIRSVEKVMLGPERKSHVLSAREKKITAYHEMGHALVASVLPHSDPVHKVSIVSRGHAAGYTLKLPFEDRRLQSRKEFLDDLAVSFGGYAAEQMIFGDITTGAANDIAVATALARNMVAKYGMSEKLGPMAFETGGGQRFSWGAGWVMEGVSSEAAAAKVDAEVARLLAAAFSRAKKVLTDCREALDKMAAEIMRVETLDREDFEKLLILNGIKPKKREEEPGEGITIAPDQTEGAV